MKTTSVHKLMDQLGKLKAYYSYQCCVLEAVIDTISKLELQQPIDEKHCRHTIESFIEKKGFDINKQIEAVLSSIDLNNFIETHNNRLDSTVKSDRYELLASMEINSFMQEDFLTSCRKQYSMLQHRSNDCFRFVEIAQQYTSEPSLSVKQQLAVLLNDMDALGSVGLLEKCRDQFSHFVTTIKDVFVKTNHDTAIAEVLKSVKREVAT